MKLVQRQSPSPKNNVAYTRHVIHDQYNQGQSLGKPVRVQIQSGNQSGHTTSNHQQPPRQQSYQSQQLSTVKTEQWSNEPHDETEVEYGTVINVCKRRFFLQAFSFLLYCELLFLIDFV